MNFFHLLFSFCLLIFIFINFNVMMKKSGILLPQKGYRFNYCPLFTLCSVYRCKRALRQKLSQTPWKRNCLIFVEF